MGSHDFFEHLGDDHLSNAAINKASIVTDEGQVLNPFGDEGIDEPFRRSNRQKSSHHYRVSIPHEVYRIFQTD
jgi:hypothetical protein